VGQILATVGRGLLIGTLAGAAVSVGVSAAFAGGGPLAGGLALGAGMVAGGIVGYRRYGQNENLVKALGPKLAAVTGTVMGAGAVFTCVTLPFGPLATAALNGSVQGAILGVLLAR
jgi:hypothetical protein